MPDPVVQYFLVYGAVVVSASERSRDAFAPGDHRSVWGWPFTIWRRPD